MTTRLQKWDILKAFLIFFVVLGHAADFYTQQPGEMRNLYFFIYIFHMPLFIFISGLFSKKTVNERKINKILGYFILYVFIKFIHFIYNALTYQYYQLDLFTEGGLPWFMFALFAFSIITILVKDISPVYVLTVSVVLACIVGYDPRISDYLALSRIFVYFPFYYLGYCLDSQKIETFCKGKAKKILSFIFLIALFIFVFSFGDEIYWMRALLTGRNTYMVLGEYEAYGFFLRLLVYAISTITCLAIIIITPNKLGRGWIAKIGQRTLPVYIFHYIILSFLYNQLELKNLFAKISPQFAGYFIIPLSAILTVILSRKIFQQVISYIINVPTRQPKS